MQTRHIGLLIAALVLVAILGIVIASGAAGPAATVTRVVSHTYETPAATTEGVFHRVQAASTVTRVCYLLRGEGASEWTGQIREYDSNAASPANIQAADTAATEDVNSCVTSFANDALDAGDYLGASSTAISATTTNLTVTVYYSVP